MVKNCIKTAIVVRSDNKTANPIRNLWDLVGRFEFEPSMVSLEFSPHITLAIYDEIDDEIINQTFRRIFYNQKVLEIEFKEINYFDVEPTVVWAAPKHNSRLSHLHQLIHSSINPELCSHHYRPGQWIPHCTLGMNINRNYREEAMSLVQSNFEPFKVKFDFADLIRFLPLQVIAEQNLIE